MIDQEDELRRRDEAIQEGYRIWSMQNKTVEGFELTDDFELKFTLLTAERIGGNWLYFRAVKEHNESRGKRRPYWSVVIGPWHFQSGWLFDCEGTLGSEQK